MPALAGYEKFELKTERTGTALPFEGTLIGWGDEHEHRVVEHAILGRAGAIHQSNKQAPKRMTFRVLLRDDGKIGEATIRYKAAVATLADDPFCALIHPRLGEMNVICNGLKTDEDLDGSINALTAELKLTETGLLTTRVQVASITARAAASASTSVIERIGRVISRINSLPAPSVATILAGSPLAHVPPQVSSLASLAASLYAATADFVTFCDDTSTDQYALAAQLVQVGNAVEAFAASAGVALGAGSVGAYPLISQARLAYGQALAAYQLAARNAVPIVPRRVPGKMSLARFCVYLYGGGARALEAEILRLNKGQIRYPYAIPAGTILLVPDPAKVRLDSETSAPVVVT